MRTHLALGLFSLILMCATTAHGEDDSAARAEAETLVENGIRFARSGDFNGAIDQFEAALKLYPSAEIMHSLARAHEEAGHLSKAHSWFEKALSTTPNYLYAEDARERIYAIESRLRKTHALLHIRSTPAQARVSISAGEHKARHLVTPVSWWVPAGAVMLSGERSGFEPRDQDVTVQAGEVRTLELVLTPIQAKGFVTVTASEVGAVVKVDGQKVGTIPLGTLTLTEGTHIIEVQGADGSTMTRTVTIIANEAAPAVAFNLSAPATSSPADDNRVLWAGVSFGSSLGMAILGAVFHVKYWDKGHESNEAWDQVDFHNGQFKQEQQAQGASVLAIATWEEAEQARIRMIGCYSVGGALAGLGVYMLLKSPGHSVSSSSDTTWSPTLSAGANHLKFGAHLRF